MEVTGGAAARLYVKGAVSATGRSIGLAIQMYRINHRLTDSLVATIQTLCILTLTPYSKTQAGLCLRDVIARCHFNFTNGGPASGMQVDNFMARWTGYITVPKAGQYKLRADSDDGIRIKVSTGSWQTSLDSWQDQAGRFIGNAVSLPTKHAHPYSGGLVRTRRQRLEP